MATVPIATNAFNQNGVARIWHAIKCYDYLDDSGRRIAFCNACTALINTAQFVSTKAIARQIPGIGGGSIADFIIEASDGTTMPTRLRNLVEETGVQADE